MRSLFSSHAMRIRLLTFASLALLTAACSTPPIPSAPEPTDTEEFSTSSAEEAAAETRNVSFIGIVQPVGITITMEGTHRLDLGDGRFILLASESVDLNGYVGERAEATGSIRPTVEEGGTIMRVEQIRLIESSSSSAIAAENASAADASQSSAIAAGAPASSAAASSKNPVASSVAVAPTSSRASSALPPPPADQSAQVKVMAKQNLAASNWTQAYCAPPTAGFCLPIHRNWYFKSFGTQTQALWRVEVGPEAIESVGQGVITVILLSGDIAEGVADGQVRAEGSMVTGYRAWTKNRHLRITAPGPLMRDAVTYITSHFTPVEE